MFAEHHRQQGSRYPGYGRVQRHVRQASGFHRPGEHGGQPAGVQAIAGDVPRPGRVHLRSDLVRGDVVPVHHRWQDHGGLPERSGYCARNQGGQGSGAFGRVERRVVVPGFGWTGVQDRCVLQAGSPLRQVVRTDVLGFECSHIPDRAMGI